MTWATTTAATPEARPQAARARAPAAPVRVTPAARTIRAVRDRRLAEKRRGPERGRWPELPAGGPNPLSRSRPSIRAAVSPTSQRTSILLVEDERAITDPLAEALEREGFDTTVADTASEALERARAEPDLVLLDIGLPDGSGLDVCRELRRHSDVPVIMLTARGAEADRVAGLELGADDYIVKPFSAREVVARVRAVLRRGGPPPPPRGVGGGRRRVAPPPSPPPP